MAISGLVITYNEALNIGKCVDALLRVCDEVIVIDSNSTDATVQIATEKGATVYKQSFLGDGPQRIYGLQFCKNDWVLNLDADEFLDADSERFIASGSFYTEMYDAYAFRTKNFLKEKVICFSCWYPDYKIRFFNQKTARPSTAMVHQSVQSTRLKYLSTHLLHYGSNSFYQILSKKSQYAEWHAEQLFASGKRVGVWKPFVNGWVSFFKCYFFKKGIFNGIDGFTFALIQGFFSYMKYANLIKLQRNWK